MDHELLNSSIDIEKNRQVTRLLRRDDFEGFLAETRQDGHRFLDFESYIAKGDWIELVMRWIVVDDLWKANSSIEAILLSRIADGLMASEDYDLAYRVLSILRDSPKAIKKRKRCLNACISAEKARFPKLAFAQRCLKYYDSSDLAQASQLAEQARYTLDPEDIYFETEKITDPAVRLRLRLHPTSGKIDKTLAQADFEDLKDCPTSLFVWEAKLEYALFIKDYPKVKEILEILTALEPRDSLFSWLAWFFDILIQEPHILETYVLCQWLINYILPIFDCNCTIINALETRFLDIPTALEPSQDIYPLTAALRAQQDSAYTSEDILKILDNLDEELEKDITALIIRLHAYENLDDPRFVPLVKEAQKRYPGPSFELIAFNAKEIDKSTRAAALENLLYAEDPTVLYEIDRDETEMLMDYLPENLRNNIRVALALIDLNLEASPYESVASIDILDKLRQEESEKTTKDKQNIKSKASYVVLAMLIMAILMLIYFLNQSNR